MGLFHYNYSAPGRGLSKEEARKRSYFGILWTKLGKIAEVNGIFLFSNFIQIAALLYMIMPVFMVTDKATATELGSYMVSIITGKKLIPIYIFIPIMLMGPTSCGLNYICRNFAKLEPVFIWTDFWNCVKSEFWKSLFAGIIMVLTFYVFLNASLFYLNSSANTVLVLILVINLGLVLTMASFYVYPLLITFDMKLRHIFKNAVIMAFLNLPQNVGVLITIIIINLVLMLTLPIIVWILATVVFLIGWQAYTINYVTWTAIDKFLIEKE